MNNFIFIFHQEDQAKLAHLIKAGIAEVMQSNLSRIIPIVRFVHNPIIGAFEANRGWVPKMWVLFLAAYTQEGKVGSYIVSN